MDLHRRSLTNMSQNLCKSNLDDPNYVKSFEGQQRPRQVDLVTPTRHGSVLEPSKEHVSQLEADITLRTVLNDRGSWKPAMNMSAAEFESRLPMINNDQAAVCNISLPKPSLLNPTLLENRPLNVKLSASHMEPAKLDRQEARRLREHALEKRIGQNRTSTRLQERASAFEYAPEPAHSASADSSIKVEPIARQYDPEPKGNYLPKLQEVQENDSMLSRSSTIADYLGDIEDLNPKLWRPLQPSQYSQIITSPSSQMAAGSLDAGMVPPEPPFEIEDELCLYHENQHDKKFCSRPKFEIDLDFRAIKLFNLPQNATSKSILSIIHGGMIERLEFEANTTVATVVFMRAADCSAFYTTTAQGVKYPHDDSRTIGFALVTEAPVDPQLLEKIERHRCTRCVRLNGISDDWTLRDIKQLAQGPSHQYRVEHITIGCLNAERRVVDVRFCDIKDAIEFKGSSQHTPKLRGCEATYLEDPCSRPRTSPQG